MDNKNHLSLGKIEYPEKYVVEYKIPKTISYTGKMLIDIYESPYLIEPKQVKRSWKERLFERPWRPFKKFKTIMIPSEKIYEVGGAFICHPEMKQKIEQRLKEENFYKEKK